MQWVADRDHLVAGVHRADADRGNILFLGLLWPLQQRQVIFFVGGDDAQLDRSLPGEIAMNVADAIGDNVTVGDDMGVFADDKAPARTVTR